MDAHNMRGHQRKSARLRPAQQRHHPQRRHWRSGRRLWKRDRRRSSLHLNVYLYWKIVPS
jgi:hypothetical protein